MLLQERVQDFMGVCFREDICHKIHIIFYLCHIFVLLSQPGIRLQVIIVYRQMFQSLKQ